MANSSPPSLVLRHQFDFTSACVCVHVAIDLLFDCTSIETRAFFPGEIHYNIVRGILIMIFLCCYRKRTVVLFIDLGVFVCLYVCAC